MNQEFDKFMEMVKDKRFDIYFNRVLKEKNASFDAHYVFHTAWAARVLADIRPEKHVDIASSLYFNTLASAFVPIDFYDYRVAHLDLPGLQTNFADLPALPFADNSVPSLSCMHVVEHIGLGRYGDPIDPQGDLKAMAELKRVLVGDLLFAVPIGRPKVIFNLHRIYSYEQVIEYFKELKLVEFVLISDSGNLIRNASPELVAEQGYGCGCFWFRKD